MNLVEGCGQLECLVRGVLMRWDLPWLEVIIMAEKDSAEGVLVEEENQEVGVDAGVGMSKGVAWSGAWGKGLCAVGPCGPDGVWAK